jgi:hypothetical protein
MRSFHISSLRPVASRAAACALGVCVTAGSLGPLYAQSLGDVARKEEERRKTVKAPKVYTDKDVGSVRAATPAPTVSSAGEAAGASTGAATPPSPDAPAGAAGEPPPAGAGAVKDQAYWADRMKTLRDQVARDQTFAEALQTRVNVLAADFVNRDDPAQRTSIEQDRQKAMAELARLRQAIIDGQQAIADLEDEARRSGVPAGWLR